MTNSEFLPLLARQGLLQAVAVGTLQAPRDLCALEGLRKDFRPLSLGVGLGVLGLDYSWCLSLSESQDVGT